MAPNPLAADLAHFLAHTEAADWELLRGRTVFLTGGGGFFGRWLLESFFAANDHFGLNARLLALTRDTGRFRAGLGAVAARPDLAVLQGRASDFRFPAAEVGAVIHAGIEYGEPRALYDEAVAGTRRVLEFARDAAAHRFLFVSSGAVYGRQPADLAGIPETWTGGPALGDPSSAYAEAKRAGEFLCGAFHAEFGLPTVCARAFAFLGPHQLLNLVAAAGNFLADALAARPIQIAGDGTPLRSYLYAADLAIWLWRLLLRGAPGQAYNVGGEEVVSIRELAELVAEVVHPGLPVVIARPPDSAVAPARYLPDVSRARSELGLAPLIGLRESLARTASWHRTRARA